MTVRVLLIASALSLGLASAATAQGMQPGMGGGQMQQGARVGDDMGQAQRPMPRSGRAMRKPAKGGTMMRSRGRMSGPGARTGEGM